MARPVPAVIVEAEAMEFRVSIAFDESCMFEMIAPVRLAEIMLP